MSMERKHNLQLLQHLEKRGYRASIVSASHVDELGEEIRTLHERGQIYDEFYRQYENPYFHPKLPGDFKDAKSIVVMATPQPMIRTTFHFKGRDFKLMVPPTYFDGNKVTSKARRDLKTALGPKEYRAVRATLPQKLLAARSGLAMYGRNNITYIPGLGSLYRLTSFYTDYESPVDMWQDREMLPQCAKCKACMKACPTMAIQEDRFLLHVDRCLTYMNEKSSEHAFPEWVDRGAHNMLIGCMRCQRSCPYDKDLVNWYEDRGEFNEEETAYLLKGVFREKEAERMNRKLKRIGLDLTVFPRNLDVLLDRES
jgi:epoxyqueuosine reductase